MALEFRGRVPVELKFGTSGLRGLVCDISDLEAYVNTRGFLAFATAAGDCRAGADCYIGLDLRPSTPRIAAAVTRAVRDAGLVPRSIGCVPTPALLLHAAARGAVSVMVTGSHIPFDRNGIKFNRAAGEVLKADEAPILAAVRAARRAAYEAAPADAPFADDGAFRAGEQPALPAVEADGAAQYAARYSAFFGADALADRTLVFYQHSAVGRDLLPDVLRSVGATVHEAGRSDTFVPIDTEAIADEQLAVLQKLADEARAAHGDIDAIVSTDGDSDRPMMVGVERETGRVRFFGGDLLGLVVAEWLLATHVAVPISSNDAVDLQLAKRGLAPLKTKIGSPYVVRAMMDAAASDAAAAVVGWEANGGFLTGAAIERAGRRLTALPTRDAALPIIACLAACTERKLSVAQLFATLPQRFSKAGLLDNFARASSLAILALFKPAGGDASGCVALDAGAHAQLIADLRAAFTEAAGFGAPQRVDYTDGVRVYFANGDIAHIRPSGNAPQLRIYAVAGTQERADAIVAQALAGPDGLLRQLEQKIQAK